MKKLYWLLLVLSFNLYSQCFDCNKNVGDWVGDVAMDIEKLPDGIVYLVHSGGFTSGYINKYDFNCNLVWSKTFGYDDVVVQSVTSDPDGNIYLIIENTTSTNAGLGPWNVSGWIMSPGINFYKLNPQGDIIWNRHIGPRTAVRLQNIVFSENILFITGTFYDNLTFSEAVSFSHPYTDYARAFIAKYDIDGNFIDAVEHGNGQEIFGLSEIDPQGNTYFTYNTPNHEYSRLDKFDSDLNLMWSSTLTTAPLGNNTEGIYHPNGIRFNSENQKLYLWGGMNLNVNIMGHPFFISDVNGIFQSALTEFDTSTGALTNIARFDNNSTNSVPAINGTWMNKTAFMAEKEGDLYLLTSFTGNIDFSNGSATTPTYENGAYSSEELLLFKVKLSDFTFEFIFQSHGEQDLNTFVADFAGPIVFNNDDLYLTATFQSTPLSINGSLISNNSGNHDPDGMLYKFNVLDQPGSGTIVVENTCLNNISDFTLEGVYDSVTWNFGEPLSPNNVSTEVSPQHQYLTVGTFHVTAEVNCGSSTQIVERDVTITEVPYINTIPALTACEDSNGSGISSAFDTSQLKELLVGAQPDISLAYFTTAGVALPSPLPNPFTNTIPDNESVVVRAFFQQNSSCFVESSISFTTLSTPLAPTAVSQQTFCVQQNSVIDNIAVTQSNVIWHDSSSSGNIVSGGAALVDGTTYYGSLMIGNCEGPRIPVTVSIQSTPTPTGLANQMFCTSANPTLSEVTVVGDNLIWYDSIGGVALAPSTGLIDGTTYYVTQTINGCQSINHLAVTVNVQTTLNARDVSQVYCDESNDGSEIIALNSFQLQIIDSPEQYSYSFFNSFASAENGIDEISNIYELPIGTSFVFAHIVSTTGCSQIVRVMMTLIESPQVNIPDTVPLCADIGNVLIHAGNFDDYLWSTGETSSSILVSTPGSYWVTVTEIHNDINCSATANFNIFLSDAPTIVNVEVTDWTSNSNSIVVQVEIPGEYEYSIDGIHFQASHIFNNLQPGKYTVYVRDVYRCGISTAEVVLLMYPKFFTPNGDGYNDAWAVQFSALENGLSTTIYDRYGKRIHAMSNIESWDGKFNGKDLPSTDYWFVVKRADGNEYRGHFTLKR